MKALMTGLLLVLASAALGCANEKAEGSAPPSSPTATALAPQDVVRNFYASLLQNDLEGFNATLAPEMDQQMRRSLLQAFSTLQRASESRKDNVRITQVSVRTVGNGAVEVDAVFKAGTPETVSVRQLDGKWLIYRVR
jgi:ketosteroid isomerase-like protein